MDKTLWSETSFPSAFPSLAGKLQVDVAIIGGGITGLSAAWHLKKQGLRVAVLEARQVGSGTTGSSTGNLYVPVGPRLHAIRTKHGEDVMRTVVESRMRAMSFVKQRILEQGIECGYAQVPFHLFSAPDDAGAEDVAAEYDALEAAGLVPEKSMPTDFPFNATCLTTLRGQAQFNPLQYARGLAAVLHDENCMIFENSQVLEAEDGEPCRVATAEGSVTARHVIKATHTPQGLYAVHAGMPVQREHVMVARVNEKLHAGIYWNASSAWRYSLRPWSWGTDNYLLVLGEAHTPGEQDPEQRGRIEGFIRSHFPTATIAHTWSAQNYQSADLLPYIGTSPLESHTWIATGFAADGLVWGTLAGELISAAICGNQAAYAELYDPKRVTPLASAKNALKENATVTRHLLKDYLFYARAVSLQDIAPGEGKTLKLDGERVAAYRNEAGELQVVSAVCPHLGCIVHWNGIERSWDCPCHGSRFSIDGTVLEGPAQSNLASQRDDSSL